MYIKLKNIPLVILNSFNHSQSISRFSIWECFTKSNSHHLFKKYSSTCNPFLLNIFEKKTIITVFQNIKMCFELQKKKTVKNDIILYVVNYKTFLFFKDVLI